MQIRINSIQHDEDFFGFEDERNETRFSEKQNKQRLQQKRRRGPPQN